MSDTKPGETSMGKIQGVSVSGANLVASTSKAAVDRSMSAAAKPAEAAAGRETPQPAPKLPMVAASEAADAIRNAVSSAAATVAPAAASAAQATATRLESAIGTTTPATINATMERAMTTTEEFLSFGRSNFEAFIKSGQIWAAGMQDLGRTVAESAQAQLDQTMTTMKAMASVKSLHEAIELQSSLARTAIEKVVTDGSKLTDASFKLAEQTIAPLTARVSVASERFGRVA